MDVILGGILSIIVILIIGLPWLLIVAVPVGLFFAALLTPFIYLFSQSIIYLFERRPIRILIADDDELSIAPLISVFKSLPIEISIVEKGVEALRRLSAEHFDLLVLDLSMPDIDGDQVLMIADNMMNGLKPLPVMIYTSNRLRGERVKKCKFDKFTINSVSSKSMNFNLLKRQVETLFGF